MNELDGRERQILTAWADGPIPSDFADRVMSAYDDASAPSPVVHMKRRDAAIAVMAAGLAALVVASLLTGRAWLERRHDSEVAVAALGSSENLAELRASAHATLERHCGACHDHEGEDATAAALGVFDLARNRWWTMMSDSQLGVAIGRIESERGVAPVEANQIAAFVAAELAYRSQSKS